MFVLPPDYEKRKFVYEIRNMIDNKINNTYWGSASTAWGGRFCVKCGKILYNYVSDICEECRIGVKRVVVEEEKPVKVVIEIKILKTDN